MIFSPIFAHGQCSVLLVYMYDFGVFPRKGIVLVQALKKAKAKVTRLTNKLEDAQITIAKLCDILRHSLSNFEYNISIYCADIC